MMNESRAISTTARVFEAVRYLHSVKQRPVSASEVQTVSELAADTVGDSLKRLLEHGQIARPGRGMYEPVAKHPEPRAISQTMHPDGTVKIEIGDEVIALTPLEHRALVRMLGGVMAEAAQMAAESAALQQLAVQAAQIARLAQTMNEQRRRADH